MPKLLLITNGVPFFLSHRLPVALAAKRAGYDVHFAAPDHERAGEVAAHGVTFHALPHSRSGKNPLAEVLALIRFVRLFRRVRPDIVHLVTIKPVVYGGIAARLTAVPAVVVAISGLGSLFTASDLRARLARSVVRLLYRLALGHRRLHIIVQNGSDKATIQRLSGFGDGRFTLLPGSGTDLERFRPTPEPEGTPTVVMACRLLYEKGVGVYVDAARRLKDAGVRVRCLLAGGLDPGNPSGATEDEVRGWEREGIVEWLGHRDDIENVFAEANLVAYPSHYGEGVPKVLLDAAASGRPAVTTDWPGCRDAVEHGVTGLLVPPRAPDAVAAAIRDLLGDAARRKEMGRNARLLAERRFSVDAVVAAHLAIYEGLID